MCQECGHQAICVRSAEEEVSPLRISSFGHAETTGCVLWCILKEFFFLSGFIGIYCAFLFPQGEYQVQAGCLWWCGRRLRLPEARVSMRYSSIAILIVKTVISRKRLTSSFLFWEPPLIAGSQPGSRRLGMEGGEFFGDPFAGQSLQSSLVCQLCEHRGHTAKNCPTLKGVFVFRKSIFTEHHLTQILSLPGFAKLTGEC